MGNRGVLHDEHKTLTHRRWRHKAWVCCLTEFKNRRRSLMMPHRYTELFFHDEAVAFAAGHRPCGECRRADYRRFLSAIGHTGPIGALDAQLHKARAIPRSFQQRRERDDTKNLSDGTMFIDDSERVWLIWDNQQWRFSPAGYSGPASLIRQTVTCLTPAPYVRAFHAGYRPVVHFDT